MASSALPSEERESAERASTAAPRRGTGKRSPAMEQFFRAKHQHPDCLLFFRLGDFYELFFEDAVLASELIDLTLTSRGNDEHGIPIPMAGVPHHAASTYIARLIAQGQRVAICEQMEDPSKVKGVVPRQVVRVVTPGLLLDPDTLDARAHNYLAALSSEGSRFGLAMFELSTSEARACELDTSTDVIAELVRSGVRELLLDAGAEPLRPLLAQVLTQTSLRSVSDADLAAAHADGRLAPLLERFARESELGALSLRAVTYVLKYAQDAQPGAPLELQRVAPYQVTSQLLLDESAVRSLELLTTLTGERKGSLLQLLDVTKTPMGARQLRERLLAPLTDIEAIRRRHDRVEALRDDAALRSDLTAELATVADLERLATRAALGVANPRELAAIADSLDAAARIAARLERAAGNSPDDTLARMVPAPLCAQQRDALRAALVAEPPLATGQGGIFRQEHDPRIAELRTLSERGKDLILELERREREQTGIATLKVRYTRVFGYYIEITKAKLGVVPAHYRRKQTVAGAERFTTDELEQLQAKILNADERLKALESQLFEELRATIGREAPDLKRIALALADLDVHAAFAELAHRNDYVRPLLDDSTCLELIECRHPVVERSVQSGAFVPNDIALDTASTRLMIITGPNMAGKSTAMRQVALAVIMAQAGGFVAAARARIGLTDRIYTRVGASDNVARGQSTFMVEMRETAAILRGATRRSLVILDEIGRGTSTYDGLAIAWSVAEHLHDAIGCRSMFATHYHELCALAETRTGARNFNVAAQEYGEEVVFLHKLVPGGANRSYGVAVAQLAGVPAIVVARARSLLAKLEAEASTPTPHHSLVARREPERGPQLELIVPVEPEAPSELETTLRALDIDRLTPIEALVALSRLKQLLG